jgi:prophage tail gpP-like protein
VSKFQKDDSTKQLVGISRKLYIQPGQTQTTWGKDRQLCTPSARVQIDAIPHPISKNMFLNSSRTFISGCKAPDAGGAPSAAKLYFLKDDSFHAPLYTNHGSAAKTQIFDAKAS